MYNNYSHHNFNDPVLPGIYDIGDRDSVFVYI